MAVPHRLLFGLVPPASFLGIEPRVNSFLRWVGDRSGVQLVRRHVRSYEELVDHLRSGALDVAWLPPIPFARLEHEGVARALVCADRGGRDAYVSVLCARFDSPIRTLADVRGARVGWVDPLSTAGYVVPRTRLALRFAHPDALFGAQSFFGSHAAVARAIENGVVDVGAIYGGLDDGGRLVRGPFVDIGSTADMFRIVESFGEIPPDVIAVHPRVDPRSADALATAFEAASSAAGIAESVKILFGAIALVRKAVGGYEQLRRELEQGIDSGVIPAAAAFLSTRPPPASS